MKALILGAIALVAASSAGAQSTVRVKGYVKSDGTYVAPSHRTAPDRSTTNNWSTQGNTNPYTGRAGTVNPYSTPVPAYKPYKPRY